MLEQKLNELEQSDIYPFHMPYHKRAFLPFANPYAIDITEIEGFDNLHHATGILQEAQQKAADLYGAKKTYYLVNGSTCGLLAAISAAVPRGEKNPYGEKLSQSGISRDVSAAAGSCLSLSGRYRLRHPGAGNTTDGAKAAKTDTGYPDRCHYFPDIRRGRIGYPKHCGYRACIWDSADRG